MPKSKHQKGGGVNEMMGNKNGQQQLLDFHVFTKIKTAQKDVYLLPQGLIEMNTLDQASIQKNPMLFWIQYIYVTFFKFLKWDIKNHDCFSSYKNMNTQMRNKAFQ